MLRAGELHAALVACNDSPTLASPLSSLTALPVPPLGPFPIPDAHLPSGRRIAYTVPRVLKTIVPLTHGASLAWGVVDATGSGVRSVGRTLLHFNADEPGLEDHLLRVDLRDVELRRRVLAVQELEHLEGRAVALREAH